jgi:hypothetical protein
VEKKDSNEVRNLQLQWFFVLMAAFLGVFLAIAANAAYELLKYVYPIWVILILFGILSLLLIDIMTYFFENLEHVRKNPEEKYVMFLLKYAKMRLKKFKILK